MRFCAATWNVQGSDPGNVTPEDIFKWLEKAPKKDVAKNPYKHQIPNTPVDVYAVGFQQVIPMDNNVPKLILKGANNLDINHTSIRDKILWSWGTLLVQSINRFNTEARYSLYGAYLLNGVALFIIVRNELLQQGHLKEGRADTVRADDEPTPLEMMLLPDNQVNGAVGIRFKCGSTSIAILCVQLRSGEGIEACADRNKQYKKIADEMFADAGMSLATHDYIFWVGDMNYRICRQSLGPYVTPKAVWDFEKRGQLNALLMADELKAQMRNGLAFPGYKEGAIKFPPNYPYSSWLQQQNARKEAKRPLAFATTKKRDYNSETPAWTGRILWTRNNYGLPQQPGFEGGLASYALADNVTKVSQYLPIVALIDIEVLAAPKGPRPIALQEKPYTPNLYVQGRPVSPGPWAQPQKQEITRFTPLPPIKNWKWPPDQVGVWPLPPNSPALTPSPLMFPPQAPEPAPAPFSTNRFILPSLSL